MESLIVLAIAPLFGLLIYFAFRRATAGLRYRAAFKRLSGFTAVYVFAGTAQHPGVAVDPQHRQFAFARRRGVPTVYSYDDLTAVEVARNGTTIESTNRGSQLAGAAVGGLLLGGVGLILGGLSGSKRKSEKVKQLSLKVYVANAADPVRELIFFRHAKGVPATSGLLKRPSARLEEWLGRFKAMQHRSPQARSG